MDDHKCVHCGKPTIAMCPRCREYSCVRGACLDAHEMKCSEAKQ